MRDPNDPLVIAATRLRNQANAFWQLAIADKRDRQAIDLAIGTAHYAVCDARDLMLESVENDGATSDGPLENR